jgi:hypothetical protein
LRFGPIGRHETGCDVAGRGTRKIIKRRGKKFGCIYLLGKINDESINVILVTERNKDDVPTLDVDTQNGVYKVQRNL